MPAAVASVIDDVLSCPFHNVAPLQTAFAVFTKSSVFSPGAGGSAIRASPPLTLNLVAPLQTAFAVLMNQVCSAPVAGSSPRSRARCSILAPLQTAFAVLMNQV